jgi:hypothetical protein
MNTSCEPTKGDDMSSKQNHEGVARLSRPIRVTLPISVAYDLEKFQKALANVARVVGCSSGVDVTCPHAREFIVDPASLQVREAAGDR